MNTHITLDIIKSPRVFFVMCAPVTHSDKKKFCFSNLLLILCFLFTKSTFLFCYFFHSICKINERDHHGVPYPIYTVFLTSWKYLFFIRPRCFTFAFGNFFFYDLRHSDAIFHHKTQPPQIILIYLAGKSMNAYHPWQYPPLHLLSLKETITHTFLYTVR